MNLIMKLLIKWTLPHSGSFIFCSAYVKHCLHGRTHRNLLLFQICWTLFRWIKSLEPSFISDLLDIVYVNELTGTFFYFRSVGHCLRGWTLLKFLLFQICWTLFMWMNSLEPSFISDLLDTVYVNKLTGTFFYFRFVGHCLCGWS